MKSLVADNIFESRDKKFTNHIAHKALVSKLKKANALQIPAPFHCGQRQQLLHFHAPKINNITGLTNIYRTGSPHPLFSVKC